MPITVRHTPVGAIGRVAVQAGQAQAQQLQMGRDIQFTSIALAAQSRADQIKMAAQDRSFALQQAAVDQIERQRPAKPDVRAKRQKLRRVVSEADAAGIYTPIQIKQMRLQASLGDEAGLRSTLGKVPQVSVRRRELNQQTVAVRDLRDRTTSALQKQIATITEKLGKNFDLETQEYFSEHPDFIAKFIPPEDQKLFAQKQQLREEIETVSRQAATAEEQIQLGISFPEQQAARVRRMAALDKQARDEQRRLEDQAGKLSEHQKLELDIIKKEELDTRTALDKEIKRLTEDQVRFKNEDDDDFAKRVETLNNQIRGLELEQVASYAKERQKMAILLEGGRGLQSITTTLTDENGRTWRFNGRWNERGEPMYDEVPN